MGKNPSGPQAQRSWWELNNRNGQRLQAHRANATVAHVAQRAAGAEITRTSSYNQMSICGALAMDLRVTSNSEICR